MNASAVPPSSNIKTTKFELTGKSVQFVWRKGPITSLRGGPLGRPENSAPTEGAMARLPTWFGDVFEFLAAGCVPHPHRHRMGRVKLGYEGGFLMSNDVQFGWRWCHKCQGLFFADNPSKGVCPADSQPHDASQSGKYVMNFGEDVAGTPAGPDTFANFGQQGGWRWCSKCQGLFFAGHNIHGVCPADQLPHITIGSGHYAVTRGGPQQGWRWCHKCEGLFFAANPSHGVCPADSQTHDPSQSGVYGVGFELEPLH